jgi:hypothetical protein
MPGHASEGLMLSVHRAAERANVDRNGFTLSVGDLSRLHALWSKVNHSE